MLGEVTLTAFGEPLTANGAPLTVTVTVYPPYAQQVLADGAVAYWRLGETSGTTAANAIPGAPAGTITGGVTLGAPGATFGNAAMAFDGVDDRVTAPVGAYSAFGSGDLTLEAWVRTLGAPASAAAIVDTKNDGSNAPGAGLFFDATWFYLKLGNGTTQQDCVAAVGGALTDRGWRHVVGVVRRATGRVQLYVNGALAADVALTITGSLTATFPTGIGVWSAGGGWFANADIDEVAIYKVALTPAQIAAHYAARHVATANARLNAFRLNGGRLGAAVASAPSSPSPATGTSAGPYVLAWTAPGAARYEVRFGTSATPPPYATSATPSAALPPLVDGQVYYWQVVATGTYGAPTTSPVWTFTARKPGAAALVAPSDGATHQQAPLALVWQAPPATTTPILFDVKVGTGALGAVATVPAPATTFVLPTLAPGASYRWQIVARNNAGASPSSIWAFATPDVAGFLATIAGVRAETRMRMADLSVRDVLNAPNTAAFSLDGAAPTVGQIVRFGLGTLDPADCIFAGRVDAVTTTYESVAAHRVWRVTCQDHTTGLNRRKVRRRYAQQSATAIADDLRTRYAPSEYTGAGIAANLPVVEGGIDFTEEDLSECFARLAQRIGGYWYVDYERDIHLFTSEAVDAPTAITALARVLLNAPAITLQTDASQLRTRVYVEGGGSQARAAVAPGATSLPVTDASWYPGTGGLIVSGPQRIAYTGKGTVGGPAAPSVADAGAGGMDGAYSWKYAPIISGNESTLSAASALLVVGAVPPPSTALSAVAQVAPTYVADPQYVAQAAYTIEPGSALPPNSTTSYWVTFLTPGGETNISPVASLFAAGGWANARFQNLNRGPGAPTVTAIRLYRGGVTFYLLATFDPGGDLNFTDDKPEAALTPHPIPGGNTTAPGAIATGGVEWIYTFATPSGETKKSPVRALTIPGGTTSVALTVPTSPSARCTARKLYRSKRNAPGVYYLETVLADNTTTSYASTKSDAALGAAYVDTDTSGASGAVTVSGIATGPAGTTARRLYRTEAGGAVYKLVVVLNDNTTTSYTDSKTDAALGAAAAGETVMELIGIPASGPGAIVLDIPVGDDVNLLVQVDDVPAQQALAGLEGAPSDGVVEHYIQDRRLGVAQATATGRADLKLFARPILTVRYVARDPKTRSGKTVTISLPEIGITGDFTIQSVELDEVDRAPGLYPRYRVTASSVHWTLEDVIRRLQLEP